MTAFQSSFIRGDVRVDIEIGAQIFLFTEQTRRSLDEEQPDPEASPFPGFHPFSFLTRRDYFGRERLVAELDLRVTNQPVVVVQGPSGSGKTSLLMAGLAPLEFKRGAFVIRIEDYANPAAMLRKQLQSQAERLAMTVPDDATLASIITTITSTGRGTLVLIADQFERLLLLSSDTQAKFVSELAASLEAAGPLLRIVVGVRDDVLGRVAQVGAPLPDVLQGMIRVPRLTREEAKAAIVGPMNRRDVAYLDTFVPVLLDDLDELSGDPADEIDPGQLQVVCDALFRRARLLRPEQRSAIVGRSIYGDGAEAISLKYLEDRLSSLGDDRDLGDAALNAMVASRSTRWLSAAALHLDGTSTPTSRLDEVLARLVKYGLLVQRRAVDIEYSVATPAIESMLVRRGGRSVIDGRRAGDVLEAVGLEWRVRGALARRGQLRFLAASAAAVMPTWTESAILMRSAVATGEPAATWLQALGRYPNETAGLELRPPGQVSDESAGKLLGLTGKPDLEGDGDEPATPIGYGPVARAAVEAATPVDRQTAVLALSSVPDFEVRLAKALLLVPGSARRERNVELWATLTDAGVPGRHVIDQFGTLDRLRLGLKRGQGRLRREGRAVIAMGLAAGFAFGVPVGIIRWLPQWSDVGSLAIVMLWVMFASLFGLATAFAVLAARAFVPMEATGTPASTARRFVPLAVPILAGAASFGLVNLLTTVGNGLDPFQYRAAPLLSFLPGGLLAVVLLAAPYATRLVAVMEAVAVGIGFAAIQLLLIGVEGKDSSLTLVAYPGLFAGDASAATLYSGLNAFAIGAVGAISMIVAVLWAKQLEANWRRLEELAGD